MKTAIVIGGGIAGCSTAYALSRRNILVTLIERHASLAQEASGNPIAVLYPKLTSAPSLNNDLTLAGFQFSLNLLKHLPHDPKLFKVCGLIQLAFNAREKIRQTALLQQKNALKIETITALQANIHAGLCLGDFDGIYLPQAAWVSPTLWCAALTQNVEKVFLGKALQLKQTTLGWQVQLAQNQSLKADIVVICNANQIKQFSQCSSAKITPVRGQINFFESNEISQNLKTIICTDHFIAPAFAGLHTIGTSYAPNDMNPNLSENNTHENLQAMRKISAELFQQAKNVTGRVAWRSQTQDYLPLAGQLLDETALRANPPRYNAKPADLPWLCGLYVNAGHGSKGMVTAPICGELIARLASKDELCVNAKLAAKLNPSRFLLRELGLKQLSQTLYG
ncbi:MAG: FAD-dependent 5-carboxymethylaminomethyl-2-thiouridine(34) oxidoreductase MnmC [Methylophilaceae bacterium]